MRRGCANSQSSMIESRMGSKETDSTALSMEYDEERRRLKQWPTAYWSVVESRTENEELEAGFLGKTGG